jgi:Bacterial Ig-like domain (group 3)
MTLTPRRTAVVAGESVSLEINLETNSTASSPTGTISITDTTTGKSLGSIAVSAQTDPSTKASIGHAFLNIPGQQLNSGQNTISATYSGEGNYIASSNTTAVSYTGPFSLSLGQASLTLAPGSTTGNTIAFTVVPNGGSVLNAANMAFSCPGTLPAGLTCSFSAPVVGSNGTVTSTLTVILSSPLTPEQSTTVAWLGTGGMTGLACLILLGLPGNRKRFHAAVALCALSALSFSIGCPDNFGTAFFAFRRQPATQNRLRRFLKSCLQRVGSIE